MAKRQKFYPETDPRHSSVVETYREDFRKERIDGFHLQVQAFAFDTRGCDRGKRPREAFQCGGFNRCSG